MKRIMFLLIIGLFINCEKRDTRPVVKIDGEVITVDAFLKKWHPATFNSEDEELEAKLNILKNMINQKLFVVGAKRMGLDKDSSYQRQIKEQERSVSINTLYKREVLDKSEPSMAEVRRAYEEEKELIAIKAIFVRGDSLLKIVKSQLKKGLPFDSVMVLYSLTKNTARVDTLSLYRFPRIARTVVHFTAPGKITEPVLVSERDSVYGMYKILWKGKNDKLPPFENEKARLKVDLQREKRGELTESSYNRFMKVAKIKLNIDNISKIAFPVDKEDSNTVVATIFGSEKVYLKNLPNIIKRINPNYPLDTLQIRKAVEFYVLYRIAQKKGIEKDPDYKDNMQIVSDNILYRMFEKQMVTDSVKVDSTDIIDYYNTHKDEFKEPSKRDIMIIVVNDKPTAEKAYNLIKGGTPFEEVAKKYSVHFTAKGGGKIGYRAIDDRMYGDFVKKAFSMSKGVVSKPFVVKNGYALVKVIGIKPSKQLSLKDVFWRVKSKLTRKRLAERRESIKNMLAKEIKVVIDTTLLKSIGKEKNIEKER